MLLKELHILDIAIQEIIGDQEYNTLKRSIVSEDGYEKFLIKFFEIIIGQNKVTSLDAFLELHGLSGKLQEFNEKRDDIIEEVAELVFKGYTSANTNWLLESKNEIFLTHLSFLKDLNSGITISERSLLKEKISSNDKNAAFELSEKEIQSGLKLLERKRLKNRFEKLDTKRNSEYLTVERPRALKYSTIFIFLAISSFAIAISIPRVRSFIIKQVQEIFREKGNENINKPSTSMPTSAIQKMGNDTNNLNKDFSIDSTTKSTSKPPLLNSSTDKKNTPVILKKLNSRIGDVDTLKNQKDYDDYFLLNAESLEYIEGIWNFQGIFSKDYYGYNATKINFAIVKKGGKYEMVWLNKSGTKNNQIHQFYLSKLYGENGVYLLTECVKSKETSRTKVYLNSDKHTLFFELNINAERFEFPNATASELIHCKFTGKKHDSASL